MISNLREGEKIVGKIRKENFDQMEDGDILIFRGDGLPEFSVYIAKSPLVITPSGLLSHIITIAREMNKKYIAKFPKEMIEKINDGEWVEIKKEDGEIKIKPISPSSL